jgi:hypothetical protein
MGPATQGAPPPSLPHAVGEECWFPLHLWGGRGGEESF